MRVRCVLKKSGKRTVEWHKKEEPQIYCYGYVDDSTEESVPECRKCANYVDKAQEDIDEWKKKSQEVEE